MPIWFELLVLMLVAYAIGMGIGWVVWGRAADRVVDHIAGADTQTVKDEGRRI